MKKNTLPDVSSLQSFMPMSQAMKMIRGIYIIDL